MSTGIPGSEPLRFNQGVGAAAQDVLAIIAEGQVRPPLGMKTKNGNRE